LASETFQASFLLNLQLLRVRSRLFHTFSPSYDVLVKSELRAECGTRDLKEA